MTLRDWAWIGVVISASVFAIVLWEVGKILRRRSKIEWHGLHANFPFAYTSAIPINEEWLIANVQRAYMALAMYGPWDPGQLWAALANVRICVHVAPDWDQVVCAVGRTVPGTLGLNATLIGLAHEFAHRAEAVIDKQVDHKHGTWIARGLIQATEHYEITRRLK